MATVFPGAVDALTNPTGATLVSLNHASQHSDLNDAVEAIETHLLSDQKVVVVSVTTNGTPATTVLTHGLGFVPRVILFNMCANTPTTSHSVFSNGSCTITRGGVLNNQCSYSSVLTSTSVVSAGTSSSCIFLAYDAFVTKGAITACSTTTATITRTVGAARTGDMYITATFLR